MDSVIDGTPVQQHVLPDIGRPVMAKANVRVPDTTQIEAVGAAIQRAVLAACLSNKEAAAKVGVDDAEFGKWLSGGRRPHFDRLFAVPELRKPLWLALAPLMGADVEIETIVRVRRTA